MNHVPSLLLVLSTVAGALHAQSVNTTIRALAPVEVHAVDGVESSSASRPIGPLAPIDGVFCNVMAGSYHAEAGANWGTLATASFSQVRVFQTLSSDSPTAVLSAGPQEFVLDLTATTPGVPVTVQVRHEMNCTPFAPTPQVQMDIDDDGVIDSTQLGPFDLDVPTLPLGPQPVAIRFVMSAQLQGTGLVSQVLIVTVTPRNDVLATPNVIGCEPDGYLLQRPLFADRGSQFEFVTADPAVLVLGLSQQPFLLPSYLGAPCLFVPSVDIVSWNPVYTTHDIPLPASVRPVTFWAQGVVISPNGLLTTNGFRVTAF